ncbi:MAG: cold-shock protein [Traorella sp.]
MQGKVKWFNQEKGFGFIIGSDSQEYFVHYTQIQINGFKTLEEGCEVEFDPTEIEKGLQAKNVVKKV